MKKFKDYIEIFKNIKAQPCREILFLVIFFVLLFIPMSHINIEEKSDAENRMLAAYKPLITSDRKINFNFGNDFENWFNDRFNFRKSLISIYGIRYIVDKYINTQKVLGGKDGWLFYQNEGRAVRCYQNLKQYDDNELKFIVTMLDVINEYCEQNNKHFYFVIVPDKSKIYGEYYTDLVNKVNPDTESRAIQLVEALRLYTRVNTIYLQDTLASKKGQDLLYYKQDTHWNSLGAYRGYEDIIKTIQNDLPDIKKFSFDKYIEEENFGDLNEMLPDIIKIKTPTAYRLPDLSSMKHSCTQPEIYRGVETCKNKYGKYNLVVYRDSFGNALMPYLGESFKNSAYYWDYKINIENIKDADVVILEITERNLERLVDLFMKGIINAV